MQKIKKLFVYDYDNNILTRQVPETTAWVFNDSTNTVATIKKDGTSCFFHHGQLYKRYDLKTKAVKAKVKKRTVNGVATYLASDYVIPDDVMLCQDSFDTQTGSFPSWAPLTAHDKYHLKALEQYWCEVSQTYDLKDGQTYELLGPSVQSNLYQLAHNMLYPHGSETVDIGFDFDSIYHWLVHNNEEGLVFHHLGTGQMAKITRKDFMIDTSRDVHWFNAKPEAFHTLTAFK